MKRTLPRDLVAAHLQDVLRSRSFASSPKLRKFLSYVVERELDGEGGSIKEFVVATEYGGLWP
jgi:hypothetical protein